MYILNIINYWGGVWSEARSRACEPYARQTEGLARIGE